MTEIRQFLFGDGAEIGLLKRRAGKSEFLAFSFYLLATALLMCVYSVMNKFYGWQPAQKSVFYIYILVYVACSLGMVYHSTNRRLTLAFLGYADELNLTVLELSYNWDTKEYAL